MASPAGSLQSPHSGRSSASPHHQHQQPQHHDFAADSIPVETLVQYLLDAKRSLSSIGLVLRANELVHNARVAHEESVILAAQSSFLRRGISDQVRILLRIRKSMMRTYDTGKREFKLVIKSLDASNSRLEDTMAVLRKRIVDKAFRPPGEEPRDLLDFVDEAQVDAMRDALKENIAALQNTQTSFDGDLLRLETDLRSLSKALSPIPLPTSPSASADQQSLLHLLESMVNNSHAMAELLASLTKHFDLCVTAVRTTDGGTDLARIKAAEASASQEGTSDVSISGVIADQESHMPNPLENISHEDRAQMLEVLSQDASEVEDVLQELTERMQEMETEATQLNEETDRVKATYMATLDGFRVLEDIGSRLSSYVAAESEFRHRWVQEHNTIEDKMEEMEQLRVFYETYASSYDGLILEVERRKTLEDKVLSIWKKAKDSIDKIVAEDAHQRDYFRHEVAEYIPTDLWPGMDEPMRAWRLVPVTRGNEPPASQMLSGSTPSVDQGQIQAAAMRLGRTTR
ncbi:kinase activator [Microdochium trichocladiopsis]|uniref:Autophagy-related protein 17 n=1 Tax=Microdochium trichocladiopsis TaxID=1682393 RepID=A0A9P8YJ47_9PEZI|nr:kinase activator [Microdochium trichocladiopsis]KAH7041210.1 kinase activator [Microdochium trichocladiopsis]